MENLNLNLISIIIFDNVLRLYDKIKYLWSFLLNDTPTASSAQRHFSRSTITMRPEVKVLQYFYVGDNTLLSDSDAFGILKGNHVSNLDLRLGNIF